MDDQRFAVRLTCTDGYLFQADFGLDGVPSLTLDEPPPIGDGRGPNAARVLAAAIGNCLAASLLHCLRRARIDVRRVEATVEGTMARNAKGRLRIAGASVRLSPQVAPEDRGRMDRCLELFEDFCIVTQSVRQGIPVTVDVRTPEPVSV